MNSWRQFANTEKIQDTMSEADRNLERSMTIHQHTEGLSLCVKLHNVKAASAVQTTFD